MVLPLYNHGLAPLTARKGAASMSLRGENLGRQPRTPGGGYSRRALSSKAAARAATRRRSNCNRAVKTLDRIDCRRKKGDPEAAYPNTPQAEWRTTYIQITQDSDSYSLPQPLACRLLRQGLARLGPSLNAPGLAHSPHHDQRHASGQQQQRREARHDM